MPSAQLDMATISLADTLLTAVLGFLLLFAWLQNRNVQSLGWWGAANLVLSVAITIMGTASRNNDPSLTNVGIAAMLFAYALMWNGARVFERPDMRPLLVFAGPCLWIILSFTETAKSPDLSFATSALVLAAYSFAAAYEYWRGRAERLISRWPAIILLLISGFGYLTWVPLTLVMPISATLDGSVLRTDWFPAVILVTLTGRVTLAFIVLAMAKERLELRQRTMAMTDPLTGLPNRRAFFRRAARRLRPSSDPSRGVAVLLFDLDWFKQINDRYGHAAGDQILQTFAATLSSNLSPTDVIGRIGGEEFAILLSDADLSSALTVAEKVRLAFKSTTITVNNDRIMPTVSGGVAAEKRALADLDTLLACADRALYLAKGSGRDCIRSILKERHAVSFFESAPPQNLVSLPEVIGGS
jgi:diguanylate cyclase (GGDEF)-like protein